MLNMINIDASCWWPFAIFQHVVLVLCTCACAIDFFRNCNLYNQIRIHIVEYATDLGTIKESQGVIKLPTQNV